MAGASIEAANRDVALNMSAKALVRLFASLFEKTLPAVILSYYTSPM